jgi:hypothetical protein
MATKASFGGGYGINRKTGGAGSLGAAIPPLKSVQVRPGSGFSRADTGKSGKKHFAGAKSKT